MMLRPSGAARLASAADELWTKAPITIFGGAAAGWPYSSGLSVGDMRCAGWFIGARGRFSSGRQLDYDCAGLCQSRVFWKALHTVSTVESACRGPTTCKPTGSPADVSPHGMLAAGCWVKLNG